MLTQNINNVAIPSKLNSGNVTAHASASVPAAAPEASTAMPAQREMPQTQLQSMVDIANKAMEQVNSNLEFSIDDSTNRVVVKVVESQTGEVIMQFPTEEMLTIAKAIDRVQQGWLLKQAV